MRATGEPGAWSETEQRAFLSQPTFPEAVRALNAVRNAHAKPDVDHVEETPQTPLDEIIASVGFVIFLAVLMSGGYAIFLLLRLLWRAVHP